MSFTELLQQNDREREALEDAIRNELPFRVGSIVEIAGYAFSGRKMVVNRIQFRRKMRGYVIIVTGDVLKKDGKVGKQYTDFPFDLNLVNKIKVIQP